MEHLEKALAICTSTAYVDTDDLWNTHDDLAQAYANVDPEKEIQHYEKAIEILTMSTDFPPEVSVMLQGLPLR